MFETIGFICLIAMLCVLIAKIYNVSKWSQLYDRAIIFIGLVVGLFAWVFYFVILSASIMQAPTITGTTETFTIASTNYYYLSMLMPVANFLIILIGMLTVVEVLLIFTQLKTRPEGLRGGKK